MVGGVAETIDDSLWVKRSARLQHCYAVTLWPRRVNMHHPGRGDSAQGPQGRLNRPSSAVVLLVTGRAAAHRPAATTTTAARLMWLAIAAAGLTMVAQGLLRRRDWARWAAVVAFSLFGITSPAGLVDWTGALMRSRADGRWPIPAERVAVDLATPVLFLAISIGARPPE
jgi:hypothetical protein